MDILTASIVASNEDREVVAFKSVICYRTGLNISTASPPAALRASMLEVLAMFRTTGTIRLASKALNDHVVRTLLQLTEESGKPGACSAACMAVPEFNHWMLADCGM